MPILISQTILGKEFFRISLAINVGISETNYATQTKNWKISGVILNAFSEKK